MRTLTLFAALVAMTACVAPDRGTAPAPGAAEGTHADTIAIAAAAAPSGPSAVDVAPISDVGYTLTDISHGLSSRATSINDSGVVVGTYVTGVGQHAFLRRVDGTLQDIPPLPGDVSNVASDVDLAGDVVGTSVGRDGSPHAWIRRHGQAIQQLRTVSCHGASRADALDATGRIVGSCDGRPAEWVNFGFGPLPAPGARGELLAVQSPIVAGYVVTSGDTVAMGARPSPFFLDMPAGTTVSAITDVNASGVMVGRFTRHGVEQGFVSTPTSGRTLPHPAYGLSDRGRIVGWYVSLPSVAYTIAPGTTAETPLPPASAYRVAVRVNHCGSIVGHYFPSGLQGGPRAAVWSKGICD
jgi:hypothetical protein